MNKTSEGFSLLELVVGIAIITIGLSAALPSYLRSLRQGEVDRYTQQLEAGFFGLGLRRVPARLPVQNVNPHQGLFTRRGILCSRTSGFLLRARALLLFLYYRHVHVHGSDQHRAFEDAFGLAEDLEPTLPWR